MWNKLSQVAGLATGEDEDEKEEENKSVIEDKEQLEQQELLIQHLKDLVRDNEKRYQEKAKEFDELSSKFQKFKLQSKAKITHLSSQIKDQEKNVKKEDCDFDDTSSSDSSDQLHRGKVLLFKRQLEQVKQQLEKKEKECKSLIDGYDRKINDLELQLNEKNILISTLADAESKKGTLETPVDKSPKKDSNIQEMYAQIVYKDSKIMELNNQILENEKQIMDLQEHIKEKDEVLQQRNRAVQLMAEDMSKKGKSVVNELDDTREQMKIMQENFSLNENDWKMQLEKYELRITELENDISEWDKKLKSSEVSIRNLEATKYELTVKNAELQKKIVCVQESAAKQCELYNKEIAGEVETWKANLESEKQRVAELQKNLDELNSQSDNKVLKARVKERTKFKALERELNELKKANEEKPNKIIELEQRVAELEEEKGSLQLKLMEMEDQVSKLGRLQEQNRIMHITAEEELNKIMGLEKHILELQHDREKWEAKYETLNESYNELTEKCNLLAREKSSLEEKFTALLTCKEKIEQNYNEVKKDHSNIEDKFKEMCENYHQMKDQKVSFELKNIELEEIKENDEKAKKELLSRIEQLQESFSDESKPDIQLEKENLELKDTLRSLSDNCKELESKNSSLLSQIKLLEIKLSEEQKEHSSKVKELYEKMKDIEIKYQEVLQSMNDKTIECTEKEKIAKQLKINLDDSQRMFADEQNGHAVEIKKLVDKINEMEAEQDKVMQTLNTKTLECIENEKIAKDLENNLKQVQNELTNVLSYFGVKTANDCKNYALQKDEEFANLEKEYKKEVSEKSIELENLTSKVEKLEFLLEKRDNDLKNLETSLESLNKTVSEKKAVILNITSELKEKASALKLLDEAFQEKSQLLIKSEEYQKTLVEELELLKASLSAFQDKTKANNSSLLGQISELESEIASLRDELVSKEKINEDLNSNILNLELSKQDIVSQMTENKCFIAEKESEIAYLSGEVSSKVKAIEDLNNSLFTLQNINQNILNGIEEKEKIISEKGGIITSLNSSIESSKNIISSLQNEHEILKNNLIDKVSEISSLKQKFEKLEHLAKTKTDELLDLSLKLQETKNYNKELEEELKAITNKNIMLEEEKKHSNLSLSEKDEVHKQILTEKIRLESDILKLQEDNKSLNLRLDEEIEMISLYNNIIENLSTLVEKGDDNEQDFFKELFQRNNKLGIFAEKCFSLFADNRNLSNKVKKTDIQLSEFKKKFEKEIKETSLALEEKQKQCSELLSKIDMLERDLKLSCDSKCDLTKELSESQVKIQNFGEENNILKAKISALEEEHLSQSSTLNNEISSYQIKLEKALCDTQNVQTENLKLKESLNYFETTLKTWELKAEQQESDLKHLKEKCSSLESKILELEDLNEHLKQEYHSLENELSQVTAKYTEEKLALELMHQSLLLENKKIHETNIELQTKIDVFANEKLLKECSASKLNDLVLEKEAQITNLNSQLNLLNEKISSLLDNFNQEQDEHEKFKKSIESKLLCLQSYKQHYYSLLKFLKNSQQMSMEISFLETDDFNLESISELTEQSKNVVNEVVEHISKTELLLSQYSFMEANINEFQAQNEYLSTEYNVMKNNLANFSKMLLDTFIENDIKLEAIMSNFSAKENMLINIEAKFDSLNNLFDAKKKYIYSLESDLNIKAVELQTFKDTILKLEETIKTLSKDNEKESRDTNLLAEKYEETVHKINVTLQRVTGDNDSLQESFELQQKELESCLKSKLELESLLNSRNEELSKAIEEQVNTNNCIVILQSDLDIARSSISALQNEIQKLNNQISGNALEPHVLEASNNVSNDLQVEVDRLRQELAVCEEEKITLKQHIDNTNLELQSLLNEKCSLETSIEEMQHNLNDAIENNLSLSSSLEESKTLLIHHQKKIKDLEEQRLEYTSESEKMCEELEKLKIEKAQFDSSKSNILEQNFKTLKYIMERIKILLIPENLESELDLSFLNVQLKDKSLMDLISEIKVNICNFQKLQIKEKNHTQTALKALESKNSELSKALEEAEMLQKNQFVSTEINKDLTIVPSDLTPKLEVDLLQQASPVAHSDKFLALENDNKALKQEIKEYKIKFAKSLSKLKLFKDKYDKLSVEFKELKEKNNELEEINSSSIQRDEDIQIKIASLSKENEALLLQLKLCKEKSKHELDQSNYIISQLKERITLSDEECFRIQQELQEYKQTWEQSNISYELQKEDNERLRVKLKELQELNEMNKVNLTEISFELTKFQNENVHLKQEVENLREHSNMLLSDNDTYQVLVENLTDTKSALEQKILTLKERFGEEKQNLQTKYEEELKKQSQKKLEEHPDQPKHSEASETECILLKNRCSEMQQYTDTLEQERNSLLRKQNLLEKEKMYLQQQLMEKSEELQRCKAKLIDCTNTKTFITSDPIPSDLQAIRPQMTSVDVLDDKIEENKSLNLQLASVTEELNFTKENFQSLQQNCLLKESSYIDEINQLKAHLQERTAMATNLPYDNKNLEIELQQAMTSLHNQGLRCEELSLEVSKLLEERNILKWKLQLTGQHEVNKDESDFYNNASSSELASIKVESPSVNADIASLHARLTESEKTCQQLRQANDALDRALANERDQRRIIQEELGYAQEHFTEEAKASDEYHILLGDVNEPEYFAETNFAISRHVRSHAHKLRRWLKGRRNYLRRIVKSRNYSQLVYIFYIFCIHIWLLTCVFS